MLLQVESGSNGVWTFASSENDLSNRPFVNTTYRDGTEPWLPDMPSGLTPIEHSTMWDTSLSQPGGLSTFDINWTSTVSNASDQEKATRQHGCTRRIIDVRVTSAIRCAAIGRMHKTARLQSLRWLALLVSYSR